MDTLFCDVRHVLRSLKRTPGFTIAVLLILALGIGMSTAMFTVFKTVLVDRLPIADQERVVIMHPLDRSGRHLDVPGTYLPEIARLGTSFRGVTGIYHLVRPQPFMNGSDVVVLNLAGATANFFELLGTRPALGRMLQSDDGQTGAPLALVLSYSTWRRKFGDDPSVVGRSLVIPSTQQHVRVVGVAPAGFAYPSTADAWIGMPPSSSGAQVDIIARLAPNASITTARDALFALTQRVIPFTRDSTVSRAASWEITGMEAQSFADTVLGGTRPSVIALTIAVALLLVIACVNIGNLSLVRLLGRIREIAVRRAIGARSIDVVRLFAVENVILGLLGGALGFLAAVAALQLVRAAAPPQVPRIDALGSLGPPLAAAVGITFVALLVFGVLPGLVASRIQSYAVLRSDSRSGSESRSSRRVRQWLVAVQIALAIVVLNGAGLLVRTLARLEAVDTGYRAEHLSLLAFTVPPGAIPNGVAGGGAGKDLIRRFEATPGVLAATPILSEPFIGQSLFILKLARAEQPVSEWVQNPFVPFEFVGADYFRTLGIPIRRGRSFTDHDGSGSERVVVVNETLARQLWPNEDALGKRLVQVTGHVGDSTFTVVGVASDTRYRELKNVGPVAYFAWDQVAGDFPGLVAVRTTRPLAAVLPGLRAASQDVNPALVVWKAETMDQLLDAPLAQPRLSALLLSGFSVVALLLSAIGLYGVMAANVRRQTHEIGVRLALGAMPGNIRQLVLAQVVGLVAVGVVAGLAGALGVSRLVQSLLFQVSPTDPLTLGGVCVLLLVVATLAGYLPARRAARIDPVEALRAE
ncbi:MAG TPA: ADOP family duplicated permease [Gemmatimonadaceae bacterium]|jgi:predicted permease|nr:ADOP family duplicated permease [Gemmatimonadaceae bacterium]